MNETELFTTPPPTHLVYIPFVLFLGIVIGFVLGRRAGVREGKAEFLGRGPDDDDLL
ncbi:MAG: hypothetical protein KC620_08785 [Myxococcales bacterium]|nr:hypothetical protein [Myxococcales bacterium]